MAAARREQRGPGGRPGAAKGDPNPLETLVNYLRTVSGPQTESRDYDLELEVRFQGVEYPVFETIHAAMEKKGNKGKLEYAVDLVQDSGPARRARPGAGESLPQKRIRHIALDTAGAQTSNTYVQKTLLKPPYRASVPAALSYKVALSSETKIDAFGSESDDDIRAKARASYEFALKRTKVSIDDEKGAAVAQEICWRLDMTVVRHIKSHQAAASLPTIKKVLFPPAATAANLLEALRLSDPVMRAPYQFEIECELLGVREAPGKGGKAARPSMAAVGETLRTSDVQAAADYVLGLANADYLKDAAYQAEVFQVAKQLVKLPAELRQFEHAWGLKRLLPQVITLTRAGYREIYPPVGWWMTIKADGLRAIASTRGGVAYVLSDRLHEFPLAARASGEQSEPGQTILDSELVAGPGGTFTLEVFDAVMVNGESVASEGIEVRSTRIKEGCEILRRYGIVARPKEYIHIDSDDKEVLKAQLKAFVAAKRPYKADGRILVEPGRPYTETKAYKHKDAADNTIDMLARRAPASVLGGKAGPEFVDKPGHKLHFLFVGIRPDLFDALRLQWCPGYTELFNLDPHATRGGRGMSHVGLGPYFPCAFSTSDAPLAYLYQHPDALPPIDGSVGEFRCAGDCKAAGQGGTVAWSLVKVREDRAKDLLTRRYFGNDMRIAELTWANNIDPFPVNELWDGPSAGYFATMKSGIYKAPTDFVSFVKTQRINELRHSAFVVDLGFGRGADLGRYMDSQIGVLLAVDNDRAAIVEAVQRKYVHIERRSQRGDHRGAHRGEKKHRGGMELRVLVADMTAPYAETAAKLQKSGLPAGGASALVVNLALHYSLGTVEGLRNFVALCREIVSVNGTVNLTCMFGAKVHALLTENKVEDGQTWDAREDGVLKYSIKRQYRSKKLEDAGQTIGVLHPFSQGELYPEFLVNVDSLTKEFKTRGFKLVVASTFDTMFESFRAHNPSTYAQMTAVDKAYEQLYGYLQYVREK